MGFQRPILAMVPRAGVQQYSDIKGLEDGGTPKCPTQSLGFSARVSHRLNEKGPGSFRHRGQV
jgi:hypothetical protein